MEYAIESRNLSKDYSRKKGALAGVDIQVRSGEIFGFIGPNGAGKTTFVKTILDFIRPTSGEIFILGEPPASNMRKKIGYLPERISIHSFLTPREFLKFQAKLSGMKDKNLSQKIDLCLERVKMTEAANRQIGSFSKGMMQRVGIAQSLLGEPDILIYDEPNSGLDPVGIQDVRKIILDEKKRGATVFLNSHQLLEVEKTCDRVAILNEGRVVAQGSKSELTGESALEIEIDRVTDSISSYLRSIDSNCTDMTGRFTLSPGSLDEESERIIPQKLVEMGARIVHYSKKQESLEEIFQKAVGNKI